MSEKFTPGPWKFGKELTARTGEWLISLDRANHRGMQIAETRQGSGDESANARLIAAAPDMYAALKAARRFIENGIEFGAIRMPDAPDPALDTLPTIIAALAKAAP